MAAVSFLWCGVAHVHAVELGLQRVKVHGQAFRIEVVRRVLLTVAASARSWTLCTKTLNTQDTLQYKTLNNINTLQRTINKDTLHIKSLNNKDNLRI